MPRMSFGTGHARFGLHQAARVNKSSRPEAGPPACLNTLLGIEIPGITSSPHEVFAQERHAQPSSLRWWVG
jgi:hypothetical protein